jgi:hypothetical protein
MQDTQAQDLDEMYHGFLGRTRNPVTTAFLSRENILRISADLSEVLLDIWKTEVVVALTDRYTNLLFKLVEEAPNSVHVDEVVRGLNAEVLRRESSLFRSVYHQDQYKEHLFSRGVGAVTLDDRSTYTHERRQGALGAAWRPQNPSFVREFDQEQENLLSEARRQEYWIKQALSEECL